MMSRIATMAAVAVLSLTVASQAGLTLSGVDTPVVVGAYNVFTISAEYDGVGEPMQTLNYTITGGNQEWFNVAPGVDLKSVAPGDTGFGLVDTTIDSHLLLDYLTNGAKYLTVNTPAEDLTTMSGNIGYKGAAPTDTSTPLFQIAVPAGSTGTFAIKLTDAAGAQNDFAGDLVPEPASMALLGLGGLALIRRRK